MPILDPYDSSKQCNKLLSLVLLLIFFIAFFFFFFFLVRTKEYYVY